MAKVSTDKKTLLYVGIELPELENIHFIHVPLIRTQPFVKSTPSVQALLNALDTATHIIITSKEAASYFFDLASQLEKTYISIGKKTASRLKLLGATKIRPAQEETQEGVIALIKRLNAKDSSFIWPHSALSRTTLIDFLKSHSYSFTASPIYETLFINPEKPLPLDAVDGIFFSSPSTVSAFIAVHGFLPQDKLLVAQGPITKKTIDELRGYPLSCKFVHQK